MNEGLTIEEAVVQVFTEKVGEDDVTVTQETTFDDLSVTKIDLTVAVLRLEEAFGTEVPIKEEDLFNQGRGTLGDLIKKCRLYLPDGARVRGTKEKKRWKLRIFGL